MVIGVHDLLKNPKKETIGITSLLFELELGGSITSFVEESSK